MMIWVCCRPAAPTKRPPAPHGRAGSLPAALTISLAPSTPLFKPRGGWAGLDFAGCIGLHPGHISRGSVKGGCRGEQRAEAFEPGSQETQTEEATFAKADRQQGANNQDLKLGLGA